MKSRNAKWHILHHISSLCCQRTCHWTYWSYPLSSVVIVSMLSNYWGGGGGGSESKLKVEGRHVGLKSVN